MRSRILALLTVPLTLLGIAPAGPAAAIANGEDVPEGRYRFAVKLNMLGLPTPDGGRRDSSCTGALVAPRWVITAGHCFQDADQARVDRPVAERTVAVVGRAVLDSGDGHESTVVEVHQNPTTDVSLARLDTPITDIPPIEIGRAAPRAGDRLRLAGFGSTSGDRSRTSSRMKTGQFRVVSVDDRYVGTTGQAPRATTSPCPRDSGGPYFREQDGRAVLVSVVSSGPTCPHSGVDLSGRVDTITDWIEGYLAQDPPAAAPAAPSAAAAPAAATPSLAAPAAAPGTADPARAALVLRTLIAGLAVVIGLGVLIGLYVRRRRMARAYRQYGLRSHRAPAIRH